MFCCEVSGLSSGVQAGPAGTRFAYAGNGFTDGVIDEHRVPGPAAT
jgi:hypothetical protein